MQYNLVKIPATINPASTTKEELAAYRIWFANSLDLRLGELTHVVNRTPSFENWKADYTPESLVGLGWWFASEAEARKLSEDELAETKRGLLSKESVSDVRPTYYTLSIFFDVGVYLGKVFLKSCPSL